MIDYLTFYLFTCVVSIHYIADFICQKDEDAKNKSKCNNALLSHTLTYSNVSTLLTAIYIFFVFNITWYVIPVYWIFTLTTHTITDYITSRINTYYFTKNEIHMAFVGIGADQVIHYTTILLFLLAI